MDNEIDIIGVSETRFDATVKDQDVSINGYRIYRNDCNPNGGGGVATYVKESVPEPVVRIKGNELELLALAFSPNHGKPFCCMLVPASYFGSR